MKKSIIIRFAVCTAIVLFPALAFAQTPAVVSINPNIPGAYSISAQGPCGWIVDFYTFALIIAGILAFGSIVYGGFRYATSAGNASKQSEGRSWIWSALIGLLLLAGAYLILNTINPNLTQCSLPSLSGVAASSGVGGTSGGTTTGGGTTSGGAATPSSGVSGSTSGLQSGTINALNDLASNCHCSVDVTSGITGDHAQGSCSHGNGCKADVAPSTAINNYLSGLTPTGATWASPGQVYQAPDGSIWANELVCPTSCGGSCGANSSCWTGPHWDMATHP